MFSMTIRSEEQFEQLVDSVQTEVITATTAKAGKTRGQKMRDLIAYADSEKNKKEETPPTKKSTESTDL